MTPPQSPSRTGNVFGMASLVVSILVLVYGIFAQGFSPVLFASGQFPFWVVGLILSGPPAVLALVATVLGVIGLCQRDRPRVGALIGTTLGAAHLISAVAGTVLSPLVTMLFL